MIQSEFIKQYCKNSGLAEEELLTIGLFAYPCHCEDKNCEGWQMVTEQSLSIQLLKRQCND